jgi:DHA2 family multidrug resistance protein
MCGSFGTSLSIALWTRRESMHRAQLADHVSVYAPQTAEFSERLRGAGIPLDQTHAVLERMLAGQANMLATNDVFWLCCVLMIILIPVIWFARPPFGRASVAAGE